MYKEIVKVSGELNKDPMEVFKDLLDFMALAFTADGSDKEDRAWGYAQGDTRKFRALASTVAREYAQGIRTRGWADPWGECYEALLSRAKASSFAQFFTPPTLCDLMSGISVDPGKEQADRQDCGAFGMRVVISDPTVGSGRNLLAAASRFMGKPLADLPFFVGEDIDELCVKMTAVNLMAHGLPWGGCLPQHADGARRVQVRLRGQRGAVPAAGRASHDKAFHRPHAIPHPSRAGCQQMLTKADKSGINWG